MKSSRMPVLANRNSRRSCLCSLLPTASLLCLVFFFGSEFIATNYKEKLSLWGTGDSSQNSKFSKCRNKCRPHGSEALPEGIISKTTDLEMRPLWGSPKAAYYGDFRQTSMNSTINLLAIAVGIKQKDLVNEMVKKFLSSKFVVMLFHYDGIVDEWNDFEWSNRVLHVSAANQTKWWFAKRFLHPEIVAEYGYIFLWDEDLGVESFHPEQRTYKSRAGGKGCDASSRSPPCTGWIEMMAPVFSRAAWRCVWYMIQNDLIHAWGLDMQLGYCAQGDRTKNVGVVDAEYIVHYARPTLGGTDENETNASHMDRLSELKINASSHTHGKDHRASVRKQSYIEFDVFRKRWKKAVEEDECWYDPFQQPVEESIV